MRSVTAEELVDWALDQGKSLEDVRAAALSSLGESMELHLRRQYEAIISECDPRE